MYSNGAPSCLCSSPFHRRVALLFIIHHASFFCFGPVVPPNQIKLFFARRPVWRRCRLVLARGRRAEKPAQFSKKQESRGRAAAARSFKPHIIRQGRDETSGERGWGSIVHCIDSIPIIYFVFSRCPAPLPLRCNERAVGASLIARISPSTNLVPPLPRIYFGTRQLDLLPPSQAKPNSNQKACPPARRKRRPSPPCGSAGRAWPPPPPSSRSTRWPTRATCTTWSTRPSTRSWSRSGGSARTLSSTMVRANAVICDLWLVVGDMI